MKQTKRRMEIFSFFDHVGISKHLEKMAAKGWMIQQINSFGWVYRKIKPKRLKFTISYYPKASEFDPELSEEQLTFHEFCAHTGWKLACTSAQLQIFYNEREHPVPIETEPTLEVESIHASAKKSFIPPYLLLLLCSVLQGGLLIAGLLREPIEVLSDSSRLFGGFCFLILGGLCIEELLQYFLWYRKAKEAAENGEFLSTPDTTVFQKVVLLAVMIGLVYWLVHFVLLGDEMQRWIGILMCFYFPVLYGVVNGVKHTLKRMKASRTTNRTVTYTSSIVLSFLLIGVISFGTLKLASSGFFAKSQEETYEHGGITWAVSKDELPLTVEDLVDTEFDGYTKSRRDSESLFLAEYRMEQRPRFDAENYSDIPQLKYRLVYVKVPGLYKFCKDWMIDEWESLYEDHSLRYEKQHGAAWGAKEVYRLYDRQVGYRNWYLLCYEDLLVEINLDFEPTREQMEVIREKLSP